MKKVRAGGRKRRKPVDNELVHLLDIYDDLRIANPIGMSMQSIPYSEIESYNRLMRTGLDPFDIDTLRRLDALWLQSLPKDPPSK